MHWVLIYFIIHWGEAITSGNVRFNSEAACERAGRLLNTKDFGFNNNGRIYVNAFCVEDK